jgi:hypothetical protein
VHLQQPTDIRLDAPSLGRLDALWISALIASLSLVRTTRLATVVIGVDDAGAGLRFPGDLVHGAGGGFPAAAAQGRAALILAEEAGHPGARPLALCALSKIAFWQGRRTKARELARLGYECSPANNTRVLLACQEADAADLPAARDAMGRALGSLAWCWTRPAAR